MGKQLNEWNNHIAYVTQGMVFIIAEDLFTKGRRSHERLYMIWSYLYITSPISFSVFQVAAFLEISLAKLDKHFL
jgi:hypothetical protein